MTIFRFRSRIARAALASLALASGAVVAACSQNENAKNENSQAGKDRIDAENQAALRALLADVSELGLDVAQQRSSFKEQTASRVQAETSYLHANRANHAITGEGVAAKIDQENYIRDVEIAGLRAEQDLIVELLKVQNEALAAEKLLKNPQATPADLAKQTARLRTKIDQFTEYMMRNKSVKIPKREAASAPVPEPTYYSIDPDTYEVVSSSGENLEATESQ